MSLSERINTTTNEIAKSNWNFFTVLKEYGDYIQTVAPTSQNVRFIQVYNQQIQQKSKCTLFFTIKHVVHLF